MTVKEYLECINDCAVEPGMKIDNNFMIGFIDVVPNADSRNIKGRSALDISIDADNIVVSCVYDTDHGDLKVSRATNLSDSLEQHCRKGLTAEATIEKTLNGLKEILDSYDRLGIENNLSASINTLEQTLENSRENLK